jgi:hypothetical protein
MKEQLPTFQDVACKIHIAASYIQRRSRCRGPDPDVAARVLGDDRIDHAKLASFPFTAPGRRRFRPDVSAAPPCPPESEVSSVPGDDRLRLDDNECRSPSGPEAQEHDPEPPARVREPQPSRPGALQHLYLVPQGQHFELERGSRPCPCSEGPDGAKTRSSRLIRPYWAANIASSSTSGSSRSAIDGRAGTSPCRSPYMPETLKVTASI